MTESPQSNAKPRLPAVASEQARLPAVPSGQAAAPQKHIVSVTILATRQEFVLGALVPGPMGGGDRHVTELALLNEGRTLTVHYSETDVVELYYNVPMRVVLKGPTALKIADLEEKKDPVPPEGRTKGPKVAGESDDGKSTHS